MKVKFTDRFLQSPCDPKTRKPAAATGRGQTNQDIGRAHQRARPAHHCQGGEVVLRRAAREGQGKAQPVAIVLGKYPDMSLAEAQRSGSNDLIRDLEERRRPPRA